MSRSRSLTFESLENRRLLAVNPTAAEQELLQLVNRFRTDPRGEFSRLISVASPIRARDPILQADLDYAQVNGNLLRSQLQSLVPAPPLAWNGAIAGFTASHNAKMIARNPPQQFHSVTLERRQALLNAGVPLRFANGEKINSENVFGYGKSALHTYAAFVIDWQRGGPGGMQPNLGHRMALINPDFEQIGHTLTPYGGGNFGPLVATQVLANIEAPPSMVVGAVFQDRNDSGWYEAGEGLGGVQIVFRGSTGTFTTTAMAAGGYQIALPAGTYQASATGGGMKHAVVVGNIQVGSTNVWTNLVYDPDVIPPDALESNNTPATASVLAGTPQTISGLSVHVPSDGDYFKLQALGSGSARFTISFSQAAGDLDLRLLNSSGVEIARSAGTGNSESLTVTASRGGTLYAHVFGKGGAVNGAYSLNISPPAPAAPVAEPDRDAVNSESPTVTLPILANDRDPDGDASKLVPRLMPGTHPAFSLAGNSLSYTAPAGYSGVHRGQYRVTDDQGLQSAPATVEIFVLDLSQQFPWHNTDGKVDVNDDGIISAVDVLLIVNEINLRGARRLPTTAVGAQDMFGFVDTSGEGFLSALDAVLVTNAVNGDRGGGEGETASADSLGEPSAVGRSAAVDAALASLYGPVSQSFADTQGRRDRSRGWFEIAQ